MLYEHRGRIENVAIEDKTGRKYGERELRRRGLCKLGNRGIRSTKKKNKKEKAIFLTDQLNYGVWRSALIEFSQRNKVCFRIVTKPLGTNVYWGVQF